MYLFSRLYHPHRDQHVLTHSMPTRRASGRTATLTLDKRDNAGALQSSSNMALALANSLTNSGSILTDGNIKLQRTGRALGIANAASGGIRAQGEQNGRAHV